MDYQTLKSELKEIGEIAATVPEPLQVKCFEMLLNHLLTGQNQSSHTNTATQSNTDNSASASAQQNSAPNVLSIPSNVKAFMRKKNISQEQLEALIMIENSEFHYLKEPKHSQACRGQIEWALLAALKNGLMNNNFKADPEEVRSIVQDKGFYDKANFASNFKKEQYATLFKGPLERQGDPQALTGEGEDALAELMISLLSKP